MNRSEQMMIFSREKETMKKEPNGNSRAEKYMSEIKNWLSKFNIKLEMAKGMGISFKNRNYSSCRKKNFKTLTEPQLNREQFQTITCIWSLKERRKLINVQKCLQLVNKHQPTCPKISANVSRKTPKKS